jgi:hypothetical protein
MHAHSGGVDHLHVAIRRLHDGVHESIPDTFLPAIEAVVSRRVRAVTFGQIAPSDPCVAPRRCRSKPGGSLLVWDLAGPLEV